jgi:hypothetical protein
MYGITDINFVLLTKFNHLRVLLFCEHILVLFGWSEK